MSDIVKVEDPGLPEHPKRSTDIDPAAAKRAERQVAALFMISALSTIGLIVAFVGIDKDVEVFVPVMGRVTVQHVLLGVFLGLSLFCIGAGAVHWAKMLMPDEEMVNEREPLRSKDEDRAAFAATLTEQGAAAGLGRRSLIKRTLGAALGLLGLSPIIFLRDLGPLPGKSLETTNWAAGKRMITDPGGVLIKASDLQFGAVAHVLPELPEGEHRTLIDLNKDPVLLIRLRPELFDLPGDRLDWTHEGIIAFSKICSHMGCSVGLYEQLTHHLLCPCHQSTFDVTRAAKVIFGPSARPLPQLAITVDSEGYLIAKDGFTEPIGPSYWERNDTR
jgi:ubiquinol-cytochrome c reductase iron-sulfur subunit